MEISECTKIGVRQLKAIEDEQLDQLPGGIFSKSFIRQYARYLGLDETQVLSEYQQALGVPQEAQAAPGMASPEEKGLSSASGYPRLILTAVCLGIAVAAVFYAVHQFTTERPVSPSATATAESAESTSASREALSLPTYQPAPSNPIEATPAPYPSQLPGPPLRVPSEKSPSSPVTPPVPVAGGPQPQGSGEGNGSNPRQTLPLAAAATAEKARGEAGAANAAAGGLVLQIDARKEVWLSITADGQKWQGTLLADRTRRVQARESVQLTVGDAGAVALTLNGKTLPPVGRPGEVKNLTISAKGLAESAP